MSKKAQQAGNRRAAMFARAQRNDYTGKLGELGMFSYERPAWILWSALANGLIEAGYTEAAAFEWLRSKAARWALDGALGEDITRLGYEFGKGQVASHYAGPAQCAKWAEENA